MRSASVRSLVRRAAMPIALAAWLAAAAMPAGAQPADPAAARRIVAIGGAVTEIIFALGEEGRLVGRDSTSVHPAGVFALPDVGYIRALSPEGVLSIDPDLIVALDGAGPPEAVAVLKESGIPFVTIPEGYDGPAIVRKIEATGKAIGVPEKAATLAQEVSRRLDAATAAAVPEGERKRVLFILSTQGGRIMAAGADTHADSMIRLAGAINPLAGMHGYKQVNDEAIIEAAPDVILMMDRRGDHAIDDGELFAHPAIRPTPAGIDRRIVRMDGLYLLGFGPRTADAVHDLNEALYGPNRGKE